MSESGINFYTVQEFARRFGLADNTVRGYISRGLLRATKNRGRFYIRTEEAQRFQKENCVVRLVNRKAGYYPPTE